MHTNKKYIFIGPPGAGKGTAATAISKHLSIRHISTGELLRKTINCNVSIGKKNLKDKVDDGWLMPDETAVEFVRQQISQAVSINGFILDGFPRTLIQAQELELLTKVTGVINFQIEEKAVMYRLSGRRICKYDNQIYHLTDHPPKRTGICNLCGKPITIRKDDRPHVIQRRIKLYQQAIKPVVEFYFQKGILINLDANGSSDIIQKKILEKLSR